MISEKANDLLNDFGGKQFDFASGFRRGDAGDAARVEARNKLASYIAALEAENAELREGRTLYDTYMSDEAMSLIIASQQALEAEVAALKEERRWKDSNVELPKEDTDGNALLVICRYSGEWARAPFGIEFSDEFVRHYSHWMNAPKLPEVQE